MFLNWVKSSAVALVILLGIVAVAACIVVLLFWLTNAKTNAETSKKVQERERESGGSVNASGGGVHMSESAPASGSLASTPAPAPAPTASAVLSSTAQTPVPTSDIYTPAVPPAPEPVAPASAPVLESVSPTPAHHASTRNNKHEAKEISTVKAQGESDILRAISLADIKACDPAQLSPHAASVNIARRTPARHMPAPVASATSEPETQGTQTATSAQAASTVQNSYIAQTAQDTQTAPTTHTAYAAHSARTTTPTAQSAPTTPTTQELLCALKEKLASGNLKGYAVCGVVCAIVSLSIIAIGSSCANFFAGRRHQKHSNYHQD